MSKKSIVLGVTGGIAAYKAADLCSKLTQESYDVHVIMTDAAQELITVRSFLTLSKNPVMTSLWEEAAWQPQHVALAEKAELLVIAPCTANFIGKFTHGIADDALSTYALTHSGKVLLAPAMNPKMWNNAAVQANVAMLKERGIEFVGPVAGHVACGNDGLGRMAEPEEIIKKIASLA
jgi:phosphopantothenoylcysteine synthetase/decarboxylase